MSELSLRRRLGLEMAARMRRNLKELHPLRQLFWECTLRCNLHCKHCGSDCRQASAVPDMPAEDFLRAIDGITPHVDPHRVSIIFTGGEPLVRPDLEDVGLELYRRGYPWGMVSNGLYLNAGRLERLMAGGMHAVTISLDGFEDDHNWLRGHPKSHLHAVEAIRLLTKEPELTWDVVTCVNRRNYSRLAELRDFLISLGVRRWRIFTIFPAGRAALNADLGLTSEEFAGLMEFIRLTRRERRIHLSYGCEGFLGRYEGEVRDHFYSCNAGLSVASILIDGSLSACPSIRSNFHQGNIYRDDFMDVWNNRYRPFRDRAWMKKGLCADCSFFRYCEGNGMHLRDEQGELMFCHLRKLNRK